MFKKFLPIVLIVVVGLSVGYYIITSSKNVEPEENWPNSQAKETEFNGDKGEKVFLSKGQVKIDASLLSDGQVHYYNVDISDSGTVYFFVVKDKNGVLRSAANACQVCFQSKMGFSKQKDYMVCNTCGNQYPLEKIATEKGGCNPGPVNSNLLIVDGEIIIKESELKEISGLF